MRCETKTLTYIILGLIIAGIILILFRSKGVEKYDRHSSKIKKGSVIIFGAGISGLSAAHELAEKGWDVTVYERLNEPGGVARSKREAETNIPSEYSWRGYGPWYHNIFDLMRRIPTQEGETVYDNLSKAIEFHFPHNNETGFKSFSAMDYGRVILEVVRNAAACPERISEYAGINAAEYLKPKMSKKGWEQFLSTFGPWVGIDPQRASMHHIMSFFVKNAIPGVPSPHLHTEKNGKVWKSGSFDGWLVFKSPTNEAWFDPWVTYLKSLGVNFHFNCSLQKFYHNKDKIESAVIESNGSLHHVTADHYILAISPFGTDQVATESNLPFIINSKLIQDGQHIQISFRIGFDEKVSWPGKRRAIVLTNSEFNITMMRQDELWEEGVELGNGIRSLWSGTACVSYVCGSLFGKEMRNLTKDEFKEEILHQLSKDKGLNRMLLEANGRDFSSLPLTYFEVWNGWKFKGEEGIDNDEPKYVDSVNTRPYQPSTKTNVSNLWMAGGHTKTSTELWSMEAAAEAGRRAASMLDDVVVIKQNRGITLKTLAGADRPLYLMGLPNIIDVLILLIVVLIVCAAIRVIKS